MSSSFPKHFALHRSIGFIVALTLIGSFMLVNNKTCKLASVSYEIASKQLKWNATLIENFVDNYYAQLLLYYSIIIFTSFIILILGFIDIAPKNDDIRFGFHFLVLLMISGTAILSIYSSYSAFLSPCLENINNSNSNLTNKLLGQLHQHQKRYHQQPSDVDKWIFTLDPKQNEIINVFDIPDMKMQFVTIVNSFASILLIISTIVFCIDMREHAMQDEYVVRPAS